MPLYQFRCPNDHNFDRFLKLAEYDTLQYCECGQKAKLQIVPTMINKSRFESYESPIDGSPITSNKKRIEEMARHDCVDYEPSMKDESTRIMKEGEAALDRQVDDHVDKFWDGLSSEKRESFAKEISATELNIVRE